MHLWVWESGYACVYEGALEGGRKYNYSEDRLETGLSEKIFQ